MTQTKTTTYIIVSTQPALYSYPHYLSKRGGFTSNLDDRIDPEDHELCYLGALRFRTEEEALQEMVYQSSFLVTNPVYGKPSLQIQKISE